MKKVQKLFLLILLIGFGAGIFNSSDCQAAQKEKQEKNRVEMIAQKLNLSDTQKTAFLEIENRYRAEMKSLRSGSADKSANREALKKLREEMNNEVKQVLSADQYEKYLELKKEMKSKRRKKNR